MDMNRTAMKNEAKGLIARSSPSPILIGLVYAMITYILGLLSTQLTGIRVDPNEYYNALMAADYSYFQRVLQSYNPGAAAWILDAAIQIMLLILSAGFTIFILNTIRHYAAGFGNLFDGFAIFLRVLWLTILLFVFVFLWSLLLVVPGIIAIYKYRLAMYLLLDHPEMSPYQCIRDSGKMMSGHKWQLFVLDLSFLGWYILLIIPFTTIWVTPYTQLTYAIFYDNLRGALGYAAPAGEPAPDDRSNNGGDGSNNGGDGNT